MEVAKRGSRPKKSRPSSFGRIHELLVVIQCPQGTLSPCREEVALPRTLVGHLGKNDGSVVKMDVVDHWIVPERAMLDNVFIEWYHSTIQIWKTVAAK